MIEKITERDRVEILADGHIQIREITVFMENGVEVGRGEYHRHVVAPGDDVTGEDTQVRAVATVLHTKAVVDAYKARVTLSTPLTR